MSGTPYSDAVAKAKAELLARGGKLPDVDPPLDDIEVDDLAPGGASPQTLGGGNASAHQNFSEVVAHATRGVDGEGYQPGAPPGQQKTKPQTRSSPMGKKDEFSTFVKAAGIQHGIVFGWGIICKDEKGEDYFDVQEDHIPEDSMLDAAADFAAGDRPGKEMHSGPEIGKHVFLFPLTTDIAKALGLETKKTGLLLGYKPPPDVLKKFESGEYTGFSIGGQRIEDEEVQ